MDRIRYADHRRDAECVRAFHTLQIDDRVPAKLPEVHRFTEIVADLEHERKGEFSQRLLLPDIRAEFQQAQSECKAGGRRTLHISAGAEIE